MVQLRSFKHYRKRRRDGHETEQNENENEQNENEQKCVHQADGSNHL